MRRHHVKEREAEKQPLTGSSTPSPEQFRDLERAEQQKDEQSLDLVQRIVASVLTVVVGGGIAVLLSTLTALDALGFDPASRIGLWVMGGVAGILTAAAVLKINRRHPYSPLLVLGLIPMAVAAYWVWT
ncbi:MAG: hypothetical protein QM650_05640 [Microlunatus sp.]